MQFCRRNNNQNCRQQIDPRHRWLYTVNKARVARTLTIVAVFGVAGCSSLQERTILSRFEIKPPVSSTSLQTQANNPAKAQQPQNPMTLSATTVQPNPPRDLQKAKSRWEPYEGSEFVEENASLFSNKNNLKPWPKAGTVAWEQQKEIDKRREKQLKRAMKICRDC